MIKTYKFINTDRKNGQTKCPNCGASNLRLDNNKGKLVCNYCSLEFDSDYIKDKSIASNLLGEFRGDASHNINNNSNDVVTLKCDGCGAEISINTKEKLTTKCHWCGSSLSINKRVDNGIIPDELLPFKISQEDAYNNICKYVSNRLQFTNKGFKKNLKLENIRGVFFPYFIFDTNAHVVFKGIGEKTTRTYHSSSEDDDTYYDADVYEVEREFDIIIDDLTIESNKERLNKFNIKQKNNIISSIMPFDTENCIKFNANYMEGYSSEKRDIDIDNMEEKIQSEVLDIARVKLNSTLKQYDRGIRWEKEELDYTGKQWLTAYLPVWLYSYLDTKKVLHYVAVNARTGETSGSIPYNTKKLFLYMGLIMLCFLAIGYLSTYIWFPLLFIFLIIGFFTSIVFFIVQDYKYSTLRWIRHNYENETKCELKYTKKNVDNKIDTLRKTRSRFTKGANNKKIYGDFTSVTIDNK